MTKFNNFVNVYTDGACRPNRGRGAIGILILDENNQELTNYKEYIGDTTNNRAEYCALIKGLELAAAHCTWKAICYSDSLLMIKQLNRNCRIKDKELFKLNEKVRTTEAVFKEVEYHFVSEDDTYIKQADKLAKEALAKEIP